MSQAMHRLSMLSISVLTLMGLAGFTASAADAEAEPELRVNGKMYTFDETWTGTPVGQFLLTVPAKSIVIHCNKRLYTGTTYLDLTRRVHIHYLYEECTTLVSSKEAPACYVKEFAANGEGIFFLHNAKTYMLVRPVNVGEALAEIAFGEECALPSPAKLTGSYVVECTEPSSCETESAIHTMAIASPSLFTGDVLKYGSFEATLTGTDKVELSGKSKGEKWSFLAS